MERMLGTKGGINDIKTIQLIPRLINGSPKALVAIAVAIKFEKEKRLCDTTTCVPTILQLRRVRVRERK